MPCVPRGSGVPLDLGCLGFEAFCGGSRPSSPMEELEGRGPPQKGFGPLWARGQPAPLFLLSDPKLCI